MYSLPNLEPVCCSISGSNYCFFTCIQISQEACNVVWYSHLFQNFPQFIVIHTDKGFGVINKGEVDVFFWYSFVFLVIQVMLAINPAWTCGSSQFMYSWSLIGEFWVLLCKRMRWVQLCSSLNILWHCLSLGLEWKQTFSSPVATAEFSKFVGILTAAP